MQANTYLKMIAGTVPVHGQGSVDETLRLVAQEALGGVALHYVRSTVPFEGRHYYFAVPSLELASEPDLTTPLAMALPGHPMHQGLGAYVLDLGRLKVVAILGLDTFEFLCNEAELVNEFLAEQDVEIFQVPKGALAWSLTSEFKEKNKSLQKVSDSLLKLSTGILLFSLISYGVLAAVDGWVNSQIKSNENEAAKALQTMLSSVRLSSPMYTQIAEYQARSSVVVRAGGWIDAYQVKNGKDSFRMFVPSWVTPDYIKALGPGVAAEKDSSDEQLLVLLKGEPEGGTNLDSSRSVAGEEARPVPAGPSSARAAQQQPVPVPPTQAPVSARPMPESQDAPIIGKPGRTDH